jgi:hypothetical protein
MLLLDKMAYRVVNTTVSAGSNSFMLPNTMEESPSSVSWQVQACMGNLGWQSREFIMHRFAWCDHNELAAAFSSIIYKSLEGVGSQEHSMCGQKWTLHTTISKDIFHYRLFVSGRLIVVAFRGTDGGWDWLNNFRAVPVPVDNYLTITVNGGDGLVHWGFTCVYACVSCSITTEL